MITNPYAAFLPRGFQAAAALEPEESWWSWRGHDVHIRRAQRPESSVRLLVVHGAGGHSGALWPLAAVLASRGIDVAAVDLPLMGGRRRPIRRRCATTTGSSCSSTSSMPNATVGRSTCSVRASEVSSPTKCRPGRPTSRPWPRPACSADAHGLYRKFGFGPADETAMVRVAGDLVAR
ncbi:hypothetical protein [Agromyces atrinae]|uniref:Pimeloyl-ACP methyl ester carboxylesterase n=1 Tax=Agromyces atrinae TaxID=592376 RepID=A0A852S1X5_9MICO|nr:hypothetical protein [Agromyces atrinae]NYD66352.1 pimeloyl-ACP methyl ester carboxylesterase [Agromyces atrinae]